MTGWIVETLVATTLLMALVLLLRERVRRAFGPGMAYALWALPVLRMLLPPMPDSLRPLEVAPIGAATEPGTLMMVVPVAEIPALPQGWGMSDVPVAVMLCWAIGAALFVGYHVFSHSRFCTRLRGSARRTVSIVGGRVDMIESDAASGPLAFGIWRKAVAFPADFEERYDELERDLALAHELGHHARGDLLANWVALAMLGFHWFNPIAWRAYRAFRADQEMACDAMVLGDRHPALRHAYGRAIVKSAHGGAVSAACHLHSVNEIKGRLRMLTKHSKPSRGKRIIGAAGIGALTLAGLAVTASGTAAADELRAKVENRFGMPLDEIVLPIPAMPEMPDMPETPEMPEIPALPENLADFADSPMQRADMPAPPPPPPVPDLPAVPAAPAMPAAPPAPPLPPMPSEGEGTYVYRYSHDGKATELRRNWAKRGSRDVDVTEVRRLRCGEGSGTVTNSVEGRKRITTICIDRIERQAELAAERATRSAGFAKATALASLNSARRTVAAQEGLSEAQRREALAGIDQALAELRTPD
ncbi:M56 family metallopeptidase [Sphingomonas qomolangmaensis]|uniref:M56 family metallopeptidase n=1 Tax=Sphingomonas qomolangmaensis TaxID=2918765 RepID=A0ABY5LAS5_9SPHN|nr:M56 family metallopeptidase [Sphingomonas qomolangmaensis]UUL83862.1 M56 family metallopeptidase [Sphingomonas qomolangmaensis]